MFSSFPFFRYGHQTADIKPFPKLTSARLFSQEPRKKLSLRRHKASLKIFEDKACKVPIKSSFFVAFIALVKTLLISTSSLSHGDKPDRFSLLAGRRYGRAEFQKRGLGKRGHETWPKLAQKFPSVDRFVNLFLMLSGARLLWTSYIEMLICSNSMNDIGNCFVSKNNGTA